MNKIEYWSLDCDVLGGPKDRAVKIATAQMPEIAKDIADAMNATRNTVVTCETKDASSEPMHDWFSLSYASYLVIPRTILQSCTPENQQRLADALDSIYEECSANMESHWPNEAEIEVRLKDVASGRYVKDDLADYQRGRRRLWRNADGQ